MHDASSIREATPFATPMHFLPPVNLYRVGTVYHILEFLITYVNKPYDYVTDSVCVLSGKHDIDLNQMSHRYVSGVLQND